MSAVGARYLVAEIEKSMSSASLTATTPPTEIGLMPNADCLMAKCPDAVSPLVREFDTDRSRDGLCDVTDRQLTNDDEVEPISATLLE